MVLKPRVLLKYAEHRKNKWENVKKSLVLNLVLKNVVECSWCDEVENRKKKRKECVKGASWRKSRLWRKEKCQNAVFCKHETSVNAKNHLLFE